MTIVQSWVKLKDSTAAAAAKTAMGLPIASSLHQKTANGYSLIQSTTGTCVISRKMWRAYSRWSIDRSEKANFEAFMLDETFKNNAGV